MRRFRLLKSWLSGSKRPCLQMYTHRPTWQKFVVSTTNFLAEHGIHVLGRRFADAGLRELLVESRTIGHNAAEQVLGGKQYNRAVRCHKTVMEAMFRVRWHEFSEWPKEQGTVIRDDLHESVSAFRSRISTESFTTLSASYGFKSLLKLHDQYCASITSPTA